MGNKLGLMRFFVHKSCLYLVQIAGGAMHDVIDKVEEFLEEKFEGLPDKDHWCFVFVVPGDKEEFDAKPGEAIGELGIHSCRI